MSDENETRENQSNRIRLLWDFQVEVVDETAIRSAVLERNIDTQTGDYHDSRGLDDDVNAAVWKLFIDAFLEKHEEYGLGFSIGGQTMAKPNSDPQP